MAEKSSPSPTFAPSFAFHVSQVTGIGHDRTPAVVVRPPLSVHEVPPARTFEARIRSNNKPCNACIIHHQPPSFYARASRSSFRFQRTLTTDRVRLIRCAFKSFDSFISRDQLFLDTWDENKRHDQSSPCWGIRSRKACLEEISCNNFRSSSLIAQYETLFLKSRWHSKRCIRGYMVEIKIMLMILVYFLLFRSVFPFQVYSRNFSSFSSKASTGYLFQ